MGGRLTDSLRRSGLGRPVRRLLRARDPASRRDQVDNDHLRCLLAFTLEEDANCVDVGCHRGLVLQDILRYAPRGRHVAVEPIPELAADLERRFPAVRVEQLALSDHGGSSSFSQVLASDALSGLSDRDLADRYEIRHFDVQVARLDDLLPEDYALSFLKIDVEGAELEVLRGAERVLRQHRPMIWFEHGHRSSGYFAATPHGVWDLLAGEHGYRIFDADGEGPLSRQKFFDGTGPPMWSYLAR